MARYGIREITDVVFKAKANMTLGNKTFQKGQTVIAFTSAKTSSLEGSATTVYAQGGRGNPRLIAWDGEKQETFTFEDALITPLSASILMGADIADDTTYKQHVFGIVTCATAGTLDCSGLVADALFTASGKSPASSFDGKVWVTKLDEAEELTADAEEVAGTTANAVTVEDAQVGDKYFVDGYVSVANGTTLTITPDKFGSYFYIEASTLWRRESDGVDVPAQITIPKGKIQSNFTLSMANSGDPSGRMRTAA